MSSDLTQEQRGYGWSHKQLRQSWAERVSTGTIECARCHRLILPGQPWDLGHDDHDRSRYTGPEHRRCNRQTTKKRPYSRRW